MKSRFPGMNPYLEGHLWPDLHNALANKIRQKLTPLIRPHYTARLNVYLVKDTTPKSELGILYPDVEILDGGIIAEPSVNYFLEGPQTPSDVFVPFLEPIEARIPEIEIRDAATNRLVTCIEILSPINKKGQGFEKYKTKRVEIHQAGVHLIEIDLIRRGKRAFTQPEAIDSDYLVCLTRSKISHSELWCIPLNKTLPTIPVPLKSPDADVLLPLQVCFEETFEEAAYELSIDYEKVAPPPVIG